MPQLTVSKTIGQVTELTLIANLKPGAAPKYKEALAAAQANPNPFLAKIGTIHFARWVLFDNDTRLLFCSNFDGTLEGYLRDFSVQMPEPKLEYSELISEQARRSLSTTVR